MAANSRPSIRSGSPHLSSEPSSEPENPEDSLGSSHRLTWITKKHGSLGEKGGKREKLSERLKKIVENKKRLITESKLSTETLSSASVLVGNANSECAKCASETSLEKPGVSLAHSVAHWLTPGEPEPLRQEPGDTISGGDTPFDSELAWLRCFNPGNRSEAGPIPQGLLAGFRDHYRPSSKPAAPTHPWHAGVMQLQMMKAPSGFQEARWRRLQFDCAWVLDNCRDQLEELGWSAVEVFGIDPVHSYPRLDCYGLAISLNGGKLANVTILDAIVERPSGSLLSYTRGVPEHAVPVWALNSPHLSVAGNVDAMQGTS
jgi:hypothetical protein